MTQEPSSPMHRVIKPRACWDQLVLPPEQLDLLHQVTDQVRHRQKVQETRGFAERMPRGQGIAVLFAGGPGTGRSTAAKAIAGALQRDLFRVDLSAVVSKYIGETEKNLRQLFAAAEASEAVLFFDEADALFGRRSEVKDSHDRYANLEVAYLLQEMEAYSGLAILATNHKQALDPAFLRRLRFVIDFPPPTVPVIPRLVP
ncbi:MAG: AAA family ATPase [Geothrix sp.]|uniref:ATP-binding protein n=1 Tax=Geothrix sp. TaxID=1962974 RepID=UPI0017FBA1FE|nr:ATP-binding protein [Geothrix sp.]NWJ40261.1 AAA family ATPase [Geothrix sp.]WIL21733.1 MAG: ATP-binding protein [Geothrix sp.]